MRTTFTSAEVSEMTAKDLATLRTDHAADSENPWVQRVTAIAQDLHALASNPDRDPAAVEDLEGRVSAFLAEDKRNKGLTPYLYMTRSLKPSGSPTI